MEQVKRILDASLLWRGLMSLCDRVGRQWQSSALVSWFLNPGCWSPAVSESSVFYKIWSALRTLLCRLYRMLKLERLFAGSVFSYPWLWCALPVVLAPIVPTMLVLAMAAVGYRPVSGAG